MGKIRLNRIPLKIAVGTVTLKKVLWNSKVVIEPATVITPEIIQAFSDIAEYMPISVKPEAGIEEKIQENMRNLQLEKGKKKVEDLAIEYEEGAVIFEQGETEPKDCYILIEGKLDIVVNDVTVASVEEHGKPVGEMSFISGEPRTATVRCATAVKILRLEYANKLLLFKTHPTIIATLLDALVGRLTVTTKEKAELQRKLESESDLKALHEKIESQQKTLASLHELVSTSIGFQKGVVQVADKLVFETGLILGKQARDIAGGAEIVKLLEEFVEYLKADRHVKSEVPAIINKDSMADMLRRMMDSETV